MPEKIEGKKKRYERPVVVPLGEVARGNGVCTPGSAPADDGGDTCTTGTAAGTCTTGSLALG